jgi:hypothetical protein
MIIVTKRCFVVAERVDNVFIEESMEEDYGLAQEIKKRKKALMRKARSKAKTVGDIKRAKEVGPYVRKFWIKIHYIPASIGPNSSSRSDIRECAIGTYSHRVAMELYAEIVKQYREQNPDALYLDKIAESFLGGLANDGSNEEAD